MLTLLDTHAWVWWVTEDRRLAASSRRIIGSSGKAGTLALSLISDTPTSDPSGSTRA